MADPCYFKLRVEHWGDHELVEPNEQNHFADDDGIYTQSDRGREADRHCISSWRQIIQRSIFIYSYSGVAAAAVAAAGMCGMSTDATHYIVLELVIISA